MEQKNWTHVRQLLGYDRFSHEELVPLINDLYVQAWEPFHNFFKPTMKLVLKVRIGSQYRKRYDKPQTPFQRLLDSGILSPEQIQRWHDLKAPLNPFVLKQAIEEKLQGVFDRLHHLDQHPEVTRRHSLRSDKPLKAHSRGAKKTAAHFRIDRRIMEPYDFNNTG